MIYLVNYNRRSDTQQRSRQLKSLIFIETRGELALDRAIDLLRALTDGDLDESSVEIIGQKDWDASRINVPGIRFYKLD